MRGLLSFSLVLAGLAVWLAEADLGVAGEQLHFPAEAPSAPGPSGQGGSSGCEAPAVITAPAPQVVVEVPPPEVVVQQAAGEGGGGVGGLLRRCCHFRKRCCLPVTPAFAPSIQPLAIQPLTVAPQAVAPMAVPQAVAPVAVPQAVAPVAVPQAVQPYAVQPYAVQPYAVPPLAAQPYAVQPYAVQPYAAQPYALGAGQGALTLPVQGLSLSIDTDALARSRAAEPRAATAEAAGDRMRVTEAVDKLSQQMETLTKVAIRQTELLDNHEDRIQCLEAFMEKEQKMKWEEHKKAWLERKGK